MTLGYIVTEKKIKDIDYFVEQVSSIELADSTKPILVVGWKDAKQHSGYKSILDRSLGDNIYWTFSKSESRSDFEDDLNKFYDVIYNNILNNIKYYYVNILTISYRRIKYLCNLLYYNKSTIYISRNMLYIPYGGDSILGLSLDMLEYCGIKPEKVMSRIRSNKDNVIVDDSDKKVFKLSRRLGTKKYAIPYFI